MIITFGLSGEPMPAYRLFFIGELSGHIERVENLHAVDDAEAIDMVGVFEGPKPLEVWQDRRKVYRFESRMAAPDDRYPATSDYAKDTERSKSSDG